MSDTPLTAEGSSSDFGIPDQHFFRLALDLLNGLELQSRERGHTTLASLIEVAKAEAADGLMRASETRDLPAEARLLRLVNAIRTRASAAPPAAVKEPRAKRAKRKPE